MKLNTNSIKESPKILINQNYDSQTINKQMIRIILLKKTDKLFIFCVVLCLSD